MEKYREAAKVIIALGAAATLFTLMILNATRPDFTLMTGTVYILLGVIGAMLGVHALMGGGRSR